MSDTEWRSRLVILLTVAVVVWLVEQIVPVLQTFSTVLILFFLAWLVAFVLEPLVGTMQRVTNKRSTAVLLVYLGLTLALVLVMLLAGPVVLDQLSRVPDILPTLVSRLPPEAEVAAMLSQLGIRSTDISAIYRPELLSQQIQASVGVVVQMSLSIAASTLNLVVNVLLVLVISFYMLLDGREIVRGSLRLLARERREPVLIFLVQLTSNFGGFLRGQMIQSIVFGGIVAIVMAVFGIQLVAVTAISSAVAMLIPVIGPILALLPPLIAAIVQESPYVLLMFLILAVLQALLVNALMPRVMSAQTGMPPLLVFVAILAGLRIGGVLGAFFGIPIMGVIYGSAAALFWNRRRSAAEERQATAAAEAASEAGASTRQ